MRNVLSLCALASSVLSTQLVAATVTDLRAAFRHGQIFVTWQEKDIPAAALLTVYSSARPISADDLPQAHVLATGIHKGSARDWWQDPASFAKNASSATPVGYVVASGSAPLAPDSGLHVHTVTEATSGPCYFAVTWALPADGTLKLSIRAGVNSSSQPCTGRVEQPQPIWQNSSMPPQQYSARGKALVLSLHGRGGGATANDTNNASAVDYLWFKTPEQGWREGLTGKFALRLSADTVTISPMDREWVNRPVLESADGRDHCPAINTWWYGYNQNIAYNSNTDPIVVPNYTQKYLLALIQWAQNWLGTDPAQTYLSGGSMGGSGAILLGLRYPQVFAAIYAQVPVYAYTWDACSSSTALTAARLACFSGPLQDHPAFTTDGHELLNALDNRRLIAATHDCPPIFATNGRNDGSIPWINNPSFYQAANAARQAFAVFWNDGDHGMSSQAPDDVKAWSRLMRNVRLNRSFPAFSNYSDNRAFGNGAPKDGDLVGWINRGFTWDILRDEPDRYAISIRAQHPELSFPARVDVTLRRRQAFIPTPGETLQLSIGQQAPQTYVMPADGLLSIPGVTLDSAAGTTIELSR